MVLKRARTAISLLLLGLVLCNLLPNLLAAPAEFDRVERIVAVGDIHGDFDRFVELLASARLVDSRRNWTGGKTHLVQTGDILDRGPDSRKIMDLLMRLEEQARKAGGRVHLLIGNHEAMNIYGDLRYVSSGEYEAFRSPKSAELRDEYLAAVSQRSGTSITAEEREKWYREHPLGWVEHRLAFGAQGKYGKWLRQKNAVIRINRILFLHGGLSPKYASWPIEKINETIQAELEDFSKLPSGLAMDPLGPLWYRGLAEESETDSRVHVDDLLAKFGVEHIVVGHTPTLVAVLPRFSGKVILVDVGAGRLYGGPLACLVYESGRLKALHAGRLVDLPLDNDGRLAYLRSVTAGDPASSARFETLVTPDGDLVKSEE